MHHCPHLLTPLSSPIPLPASVHRRSHRDSIRAQASNRFLHVPPLLRRKAKGLLHPDALAAPTPKTNPQPHHSGGGVPGPEGGWWGRDGCGARDDRVTRSAVPTPPHTMV